MSGFISNTASQASGITFADSHHIDAFGRIRISEPYTIFDSKTLHDKLPLFWDEETNGAGTSIHIAEDALVQMSVTNNNDFVIRQTKMRFNYQPAKSTSCVFTGVLEPETGVYKCLGLVDCQYTDPYNITNGIYFSAHDGYVAVNIAKAGRVRCIPQSNWNIDKMDGTGKSNVNIDWSLAQLFTFDYEWLGVGRVRMGIYISGELYYCHQFTHSNKPDANGVPYISTPNLPAHYEIRSTGGAGSMNCICCTVQSEGGINPNGILDGYGTQGAVNNLDTDNIYALLGIRLQSDRKDKTIIPLTADFLATTNDAFIWYISYNPNINGIFDYYDLANASVQGAKGDNGNTITDLGYVIAQGFVARQVRSGHTDITNAVLPGVTIDGTADEFVLSVEPLSNNLNIYAAIGWREL